MLQIDQSVFNVKDNRVELLQNGKLTATAFAFTIRPYDWFTIIKNTIYALSELQYYALIPIEPAVQMSKNLFQEYLNKDLNISQQDRIKIDDIKRKKNNCSVCRYKAYKKKLTAILYKYQKYKNQLGSLVQAHLTDFQPYPQVYATIPDTVSTIHPHLFQSISYQRTPCFDCVQKHVGMAYVKGTQVATGYPQHFMLCLANLQEAYQECPPQCIQLKNTILFCIAKSKKDNKPFIPIKVLSGLIDIFRSNSHSDIALLQNKPTEDVSLQLSQENKQQLYVIPVTTKIEIAKVLQGLFKITAQQNIDQNRQQKDIWAGKMVQLADQLLPFSDQVANIVRNRRLLFKAAPSLSIGTPYSCQDIYEALKKS